MPTVGIVAALGATAATAASGIYGADKQSDANNRALDLNAQGARDQLAYLKDKEAQDQANFEKTFAENQREWQQTQDRNYQIYQQREGYLAPFRQTSLDANNTLHHLIFGTDAPPSGGPPSGGPPIQGPTASVANPSSAGSPSTSGTSSGVDPNVVPYLKTLLQTGTSRDAAIKQTNQKFGLTTGNEVTYYPGQDVIAIAPNAGAPFGGYFANGKDGWGFVPHNAPDTAGGGTPGGPTTDTRANTLAALMRPSPEVSDAFAGGAGGATTPLVRTVAPTPLDAYSLYALMNQLSPARTRPGSFAG